MICVLVLVENVNKVDCTYLVKKCVTKSILAITHAIIRAKKRVLRVKRNVLTLVRILNVHFRVVPRVYCVRNHVLGSVNILSAQKYAAMIVIDRLATNRV